MTTRTLVNLAVGALAGVLALACAGTDTTGDTGITVTPGTWSYAVVMEIPTPGGHCEATGSGTTTVSSTGAYSITFPALSCGSCTMSASTTGTVTSASISGSVSAAIGGSGCSNEQPTPNPASVSGKCTSTSCSAKTADADSFSVVYTLTPG